MLVVGKLFLIRLLINTLKYIEGFKHMAIMHGKKSFRQLATPHYLAEFVSYNI